jgi:hypothetical protein
VILSEYLGGVPRSSSEAFLGGVKTVSGAFFGKHLLRRPRRLTRYPPAAEMA